MPVSGRGECAKCCTHARCSASSAMALLLLLISLAGATSVANASVQLGPGSLIGLGGIGSPITGTTDAMDWNPAALGEYRPHLLQFSVTPVSAELGSDDWTVDKLFNALNGHLSYEAQEALLAGVEDGTVSTSLNYRGGAEATIGGNGAGASLRLHLDTVMNPDAANLLLNGGRPGGVYNIKGSSVKTAVLGDYNISSVYSDPWLAGVLHLKGFHLGGTLRFLQGLEYGEAHAVDSSFAIVKQPDGTYAKEGGGDFTALRSQQGWGMATDVGILLRLTPNVAVDASLLDVGRVWWTDVQKADLTFNVNEQTGMGRYVVARQTPVERTLPWQLPTMVRGGLSMASGPFVLWSLQYARHLAGEDKGNAEWVLGMQLERIKELPLRMSAKFEEATEKLSVSMGLGIELGPLTLDIGTSDLGALMGVSKDANVAITTGMRF